MSQTRKKLVIIGASETAIRILTFCEFYGLYDVIGFAVDSKYRSMETLGGKPVWDLEHLYEENEEKDFYVFVALFWNHLNGDRRRLYERLKSLGYRFANIISPKASIRGIIGENCWIMDYVVVQEGATIGDNVIIADGSFVGNMARVNDHCFLGAKSIIMGDSHIDAQSFIGIGACVFEFVGIGQKCIIGACTIVKNDVPDFTVIKADFPNTVAKSYSEDVMEQKMVANFRIRK